VAAGAEVVRLPRRAGRIDLGALLAALYERDVLLLLVEGGMTLAASFVRDRLVDRVVGYHAPLLLGSGPPVLGDVGIGTLPAAARLWLESVTPVGEDVRIVAKLERGER
ncbi:MAG TPA: dihydrofolate reductase family protein, partial [Mycobacteriales bacterium]|nr:dihydrofolate reductase family protein [Mycobacteriales bacterium]